MVLFSCSEYEARNYGKLHLNTLISSSDYVHLAGRFLLGILSDLHKWSQDEKLFLQDNRSSKGCHPGFQLFWKANPGLLAEDKLMDWPSFKRVLGKWYRKLGKVIFTSMPTTHHLFIRVAVFPGVYSNGGVYARLQLYHCPQGDPPRFPPKFRLGERLSY